MDWRNNLMNDLQWSGEITNREMKERAARKLAAKVRKGEVIGAGSGSTVYLTLLAIAERIETEKLDIEIIPASVETAMTCIQLGIPQTTLWTKRPDWTFDGADEVDPGHNLIKGRGGAMFKEKLLIRSSDRTYIVVDDSKLVPHLGFKHPIPVEVFPAGLTYVEDSLNRLGATEVVLRMAQKGKDGPVLTENGNFILDVRFDEINATLEKEMKAITGVIECGLFWGYNVGILIE